MPKFNRDRSRPLTQDDLEFIECPYQTKSEMNDFVNFLLKKAWDIGENAGYSGAMNDGGRGVLEGQIEAFAAGCKVGKMPSYLPESWKVYMQEFNRSKIDPKTKAEYERLKALFGDA